MYFLEALWQNANYWYDIIEIETEVQYVLLLLFSKKMYCSTFEIIAVSIYQNEEPLVLTELLHYL